MNKHLISILGTAALFAACSNESTLQSIDNQAASTNTSTGLESPIFLFSDDGQRLTIDPTTKETVPQNLDRKTLVVKDINAYSELEESYIKRLNEDANYDKSVPRPADYVCTTELLAINADYDKVVSESGEVFLDDEKLFNDCIYAGDSKNLARKFVSNDNDIDSVVFYTKALSRLVGRTRIIDESNPNTYKWRTAFHETWALHYVSYMGHMIYYPVLANYVRVVGRMVRDCGYRTFNYKTRQYDIVSCDATFQSDFEGFSTDHINNGDGDDAQWRTKANGLASVAKHMMVFQNDTLIASSAYNLVGDTARDVVKSYIDPLF